MSFDEDSPDQIKPLSKTGIRNELIPHLQSSTVINLHSTLESTNSWLLANDDSGDLVICAAETQTAGRGRRGKVWSTPERGVTFSMKLKLPVPLSQIAGGSLVVGVAVCETLRNLGVAQAMVKWPNDILVGGAKLAGILVEIAANTKESATVVVGIGVNYCAGAEKHVVDRDIVDLHRLFSGNAPDRSQLIGKICSRVYADLVEQMPLSAAFVTRWSQYDALLDQAVVVHAGSKNHSSAESISGRVVGIDGNGCLAVVPDGGETRYFSSAEVSVKRLSSPPV